MASTEPGLGDVLDAHDHPSARYAVSGVTAGEAGYSFRVYGDTLDQTFARGRAHRHLPEILELLKAAAEQKEHPLRISAWASNILDKVTP
jgi:hypothetical protein